MNPDDKQKLIAAIESALREILPDLDQLLQQYQLQNVLEIALIDVNELQSSSSSIVCCSIMGNVKCCPGFSYRPGLQGDSSLPQDLYEGIASKLNQILPGLRQFISLSKEGFEVHLLLDPATICQNSMVCQWNGNIIECSNP